MSWSLRLAAVGMIAGLAAVGFACSDDGGSGALTLEEYFEELQALDDAFEEESAALDSAFDSDDLDEIKAALDEGTTATGAFVDDLDALEAPEEAEAAHDEAVSAGTELVAAIEDFNDEVQAAESLDDLQTIDFATIGDASERFNDACLDLEGIAADNDIEVDLNCEEASEE